MVNVVRFTSSMTCTTVNIYTVQLQSEGHAILQPPGLALDKVRRMACDKVRRVASDELRNNGIIYKVRTTHKIRGAGSIDLSAHTYLHFQRTFGREVLSSNLSFVTASSEDSQNITCMDTGCSDIRTAVRTHNKIHASYYIEERRHESSSQSVPAEVRGPRMTLIGLVGKPQSLRCPPLPPYTAVPLGTLPVLNIPEDDAACPWPRADTVHISLGTLWGCVYGGYHSLYRSISSSMDRTARMNTAV